MIRSCSPALLRVVALLPALLLASCGETAVGPPRQPADSNPIPHMDVTRGTGAVLGVGQSATIHYTISLTSGRVIDSSIERGTPFTFVTGEGQVIAGLDQGARGMRVGGRRLLSIPPRYGYGTNGVYAEVPPNSILLIDVRLLGVAEWPGPATVSLPPVLRPSGD